MVTTDVSDAQEREAFERFAAGRDLTKDSDGDYTSMYVQSDWEAFKAGRAYLPAAPAVPAERNNPLSALSIRLLVDSSACTREIECLRAELSALRDAAESARAALSHLLTTRDPLVYSDALRKLDAVLPPAQAVARPECTRLREWAAIGPVQREGDREPCPHDPARRCAGCPGGSMRGEI